MRVVIVEDEVRIREGLVGLLKRYYRGITALEQACDGRQGLEVIRRTKPDLVITDIRMEPVDGLEMLATLREEGYEFKVVILSAYAEFEYAKKAVSLGAAEYLVKPIDVGELRAVMQKIQAQLAEDKLNRLDNPESLRSLDTILHGFAAGTLAADAQLHYFLQATYEINVNDRVGLVSLCLGDSFLRDGETVEGLLLSRLQQAGLMRCDTLSFPERGELVALVHTSLPPGAFAARLADILEKLRAATGAPLVMAVGGAEGLPALHEQLLRLRTLWPWSISHSDKSVLTRELLEGTVIQGLVYPLDTDKKARTALSAYDGEKLWHACRAMLDQLCQPCHDPVDIKNAFTKFLWTLFHTLNELHHPACQSLDPARSMERVAAAQTRQALERELSGVLEAARQKPEVAVSKLVAKVESIVEQTYSQGVTLEEVASMLNLSPDHISAQFVRDRGVNFSTYIRSFRIAKAKSLLLGSDLKVYEIARKIGYTDAKYFSRVFRDTEGMLPAEYRKKHAKGI